MRKTCSNIPPETKITVTLRELADLLGMGKTMTERIAAEAGAIVRVPGCRFKRYNRAKVTAYLDSISTGNGDQIEAAE